MVSLGPLRPVDPQTGLDADDPLAALTDDDRAWLDRMADCLPPSMPVDGSSRWLIVRPYARFLTVDRPRRFPSAADLVDRYER